MDFDVHHNMRKCQEKSLKTAIVQLRRSIFISLLSLVARPQITLGFGRTQLYPSMLQRKTPAVVALQCGVPGRLVVCEHDCVWEAWLSLECHLMVLTGTPTHIKRIIIPKYTKTHRNLPFFTITQPRINTGGLRLSLYIIYH